MPPRKPNTEQVEAINSSGNVIVSAGAGSGKTYVLVERCLRHVLAETEERVSLSNILMLTFTKAAADEMRERLRCRLATEYDLTLERGDFRRLDDLEVEIANLEVADICTLHSFCLRLVKENFSLLTDSDSANRLSSSIRVLSEAETYAPKSEAFRIALRGLYDQDAMSESQEVIEFLRYALDNNEESLRELVFKIYDFSQALPNPEEWLSQSKALSPESLLATWRQLFFGTSQNVGLFVQRLRQSPSPFVNSKKDTSLSAKKERYLNLLTLPSQANQEELLSLLREAAAAEQLLKKVDGKDNPATKLVKYYDNAQSDSQHTVAMLKMLLELTARFSKEFNRQKRLCNGITYSDHLQLALRLLWDAKTQQETPLAQSLRQHYKLIFVDEFQDTDGVQDAVIRLLSNQNCFLVGDVKQSIYRFRLANPKIFSNYESLGKRGDGWEYHSLKKNYRSQPKIIHFINALFLDIMKATVGGVEFDEFAQLEPQVTEREDALTRIHLLWNLGQKDVSVDASEDELELSQIEAEARMIAAQLRKMKDSNFPVRDTSADGHSTRPMEWGDVTILCRKQLIKNATALAQEFEKWGIPITAPGIALLDCVEVMDLRNLIRILDNPRQDFPLLGILRSPLVGLSLSEITELRMAYPEGSLWEILLESQNEKIALNNPLRDKLKSFLETYHRWRERLRLLPLSQLVESILEETHYELALAALSFPERRLKNVRRFLAMIENFDPLRRQGAHRFLNYLDTIEASESDKTQDASAAADANAVHIMTIHGSKGLEFPIVILLSIQSDFTKTQSRNSPIVLDQKEGIALNACHQQDGVAYKNETLGFDLAKQREQREQRGEELRLLYVALTRARDALILSGSGGKGTKEPPVFSYEGCVTDGASFADWILPWLKTRNETCFKDVFAAPDSLPLDADIVAPGFALTIHFQNATCTVPETLQSPVTASDPIHSLLPTDTELVELRKRLEWVYPYSSVVMLPAKDSVTSLKKETENWEESAGQSLFIHPERTSNSRQLLDANKRGTAYHQMMECLQMSPEFAEHPPGLAFYQAQLQGLLDTGVLTAAEGEMINNLENIKRFWESSVGKSFLSAWDCVHREMPFTIRVTADELRASKIQRDYGQESLVVQGVIDLLMLGEKEIWILDYKTDKITASEIAARAELYRPQIELYSRAMESIYGLPVTKSYLAFLEPGQIFSMSK